MVRILRNLRIDEVSMVDKGAGENCRVLLMKRDNGTSDVLMFDDIMKRRRFRHVTTRTRKAENDDISDANMIDPSDTPTSLLSKLNDMVQLMVRAEPGLTEEHALFHLSNHPRGRKLAEHLNNLSKGQTMPQVDILKVIAVTEDALMAQAKLQKRDGETEAKAFTRLYEGDIDFRKSSGAISLMPNICMGISSRSPASNRPVLKWAIPMSLMIAPRRSAC
jgi:hypothetical protein